MNHFDARLVLFWFEFRFIVLINQIILHLVSFWSVVFVGLIIIIISPHSAIHFLINKFMVIES